MRYTSPSVFRNAVSSQLVTKVCFSFMRVSRYCLHEVLALRNRLHRLTGLPVTLKEAGVDPASFPEVAKVALNDGAVIVNPRQVTYDAVIRILEVCYGD